MYVLRSAVTITDSTNQYCLIGIQSNDQAGAVFSTDRQQDHIEINLPSNPARFLCIAEPEHAINIWQNHVTQQGFKPASTAYWRYLDIISGIPWLNQKTSEEFIPQMLNLDKLGGISFSKGCYTGQEIVARTHYLGQSKREMYLAECQTLLAPEPNASVIDDNNNTVGKVIAAEIQQGICKMLIVLQTSDATNSQLKLDNQNQNSIILLEL